MRLEGKTVIITSNSSVFLKLTSLFIQKSTYSRDHFLIIAENGFTKCQKIKKRIQKVGILKALDEWLYIEYESLFNLWAKAETRYFSKIEINEISPDYIIRSINENNLIEKIKLFEGKNLISLGCGYIPTSILSLFQNKYNIHPGILPHYKGIGTPEAIMKKDYKNCGWTLHILTPNIDSGDILEIFYLEYSELLRLNIPEQYIYIYLHFVQNIFSVNMDVRKLKNNCNSGFNSFIRLSRFISRFKILK